MKEKKYIHRKVTNQSDFLIGLPHVTGISCSENRENKRWMAGVQCIRQTWNNVASNKQLIQRGVCGRIHSQEQFRSCLVGTNECLSPTSWNYIAMRYGVYYTVRWNTRIS